MGPPPNISTFQFSVFFRFNFRYLAYICTLLIFSADAIRDGDVKKGLVLEVKDMFQISETSRFVLIFTFASLRLRAVGGVSCGKSCS